jgi:intein/homing endonuclease
MTERISLPYQYTPRFYQLPFFQALEAGYKRFDLVWHRRAGKDLTIINATAVAMSDTNNKTGYGGVGSYYYFFPTFAQGKKVIWDGTTGRNRETGELGKRFLSFIPEELRATTWNDEMKIRLKNGSMFQIIGTDNYDCYDELTEILTKEGWKKFKDISNDEVVATLKDGKLVYEKITSKVEYGYKGDMCRVKSKSVDILTTPNHKFFVKSRKGVYKFKEIRDNTILGDMIPATCEWKGIETDRIALTGNLIFKIEDWCAFIGIFLSEGSTFKNHKTYRTIISQSNKANPEIVEEIKALLERMNLNYHYDGRNFNIENKDLYNFCVRFGKCDEKYIPRNLLELSPKYLTVLKDWLIKGDGHVQKGGHEIYYTTSKRLVDDFQELVIKLGLSGNIKIKDNDGGTIDGRKINSEKTLYELYIRKGKYKYFCKTGESYISKEFYDGKVYCVEVPSHVIKVRRNGCEVWCGNSIMGTNPIWCVFSEYALQNPQAWEYIRPILRENGGIAIFPYCVEENTYILTEKGFKKIKRESSNGFTDISENIYGLNGWHKAKQFYNGGKQKLIKITTSKGYEISCTPNHKLWNGFQWINSEDYRIGQKIAIQRNQNVFGKTFDLEGWEKPTNGNNKNKYFAFDLDFMYLLGLILAEGNYENNKTIITNFDKDIIGFIKKYGFKDNKNGHYILCSRTLSSLLEYLDFKKGAKNKVIPGKILEWSKPFISAFLSGYFDGDGTSHKTKGSVSATSSSKELIRQLQILLLNYGIVSRRSEYLTKPTKKVRKECKSYVLSIEGYNAYLFYEQIGFRLKRKQIHHEILSDRQKKYWNDFIEVNQEYLNNYIEGINETDLKRHNNITYNTLKRLLDKKPDTQLQKVLDNNYYYDTIKSIEHTEGFVYDFVIPDTHSFFTNGFISHNTPRGRNHGYTLHYDVAKLNPKTWFSQVLPITATGVLTDEDIEEERREGMSEELIQQEYYCSFEMGIEGAFYGRQIQRLRDEDGRITEVPIDSSKPVHTAWDIGVTDFTSIIFYQVFPSRYHIVDFYENMGEGVQHYAGMLREKGYTYGNHYGPHDLKAKNWVTEGKPTIEVARDYGINFQVVKKMGVQDGIEAGRNVLSKCYFDEKRTRKLLNHLENYTKTWSSSMNVYLPTPKKDGHDHAADAFRYFAVAEKSPEKWDYRYDYSKYIENAKRKANRFSGI